VPGPPFAVFTDTWWWNLLSIPISAWAGAVYAEHRQKKLGWYAAPGPAVGPSPATPTPADHGEVAAPRGHSLEQIRLDRKRWRKRRAPATHEQRDGVGAMDDNQAVVFFVVGVATIAALALAYLFGRAWAQPIILALAGLAVGFVIGIARGLHRRGLLDREWKALLSLSGLSAAAGIAVVWLLRNPPLGDILTRFFLEVLDAGGPLFVFEQGGWPGRVFFAAQAVAVFGAAFGILVLARHVLGLALEVNHRLGYPLSRTGRELLRFERRAAWTPWGGVWRSVFAVAIAVVLAAGGPTALEARLQQQPFLDDAGSDTRAPHLAILHAVRDRRIVLRVFVSEPARFSLTARRRGATVATPRGAPRRLRPVETTIPLRPPRGRSWRAGRYRLVARARDRSGNVATETVQVRVPR
jgi:hypothetical protein